MMRKTLAAILLALCAAPAYAGAPATGSDPAQEQTATPAETVYYMEVVSTRTGASKSTTVTLDYGRILPSRLGIRDTDLRRATQNLSFNTPVDALNYLSLSGWHLVDTYSESPIGSTITHYVMSMSTAQPKDVVNSILKK